MARRDRLDRPNPSDVWVAFCMAVHKASGITARFHDLRHTALTILAEKGLPDQTIMAQIGHVSPAMMKTYSHIRRQALNQAADVLEPEHASVNAELVN